MAPYTPVASWPGTRGTPPLFPLFPPRITKAVAASVGVKVRGSRLEAPTSEHNGNADKKHHAVVGTRGDSRGGGRESSSRKRELDPELK